MPDVFTRTKRSEVMSRIRAHGNRDTELRMMTLFRASGITGWRRKTKVFGKPDFVFPLQKIAVFVDGCFWHRHSGCKFAYAPKSRREFWSAKFSSNVARDRLVVRTLKKRGWRVMRFWECKLTKKGAAKSIARVRRVLQ